MKSSNLIISIDIEDWAQSSFNRNLPLSPRSAANTLYVLDLLAKKNIKATMFVLGRFAKKFPDVVKRIDQAGHEVESHGMNHIEIFKQSRREFREDILDSKNLLEQITGKTVKGYRAPDFSVLRQTLWSLEVLAECGYEYDSSIFPVRLNRYGIHTWPDEPRRVLLSNGGSILEFPIAAFRYLRKNWPIGGGGYFRLIPWNIMNFLVGRSLRNGRVFVFYCHPFEFDYKEFRVIPHYIPWKFRIHQGLGRRRFENRFISLIAKYGGQPFSDVISSREWDTIKISEIC